MCVKAANAQAGPGGKMVVAVTYHLAPTPIFSACMQLFGKTCVVSCAKVVHKNDIQKSRAAFLFPSLSIYGILSGPSCTDDRKKEYFDRNFEAKNCRSILITCQT